MNRNFSDDLDLYNNNNTLDTGINPMMHLEHNLNLITRDNGGDITVNYDKLALLKPSPNLSETSIDIFNKSLEKSDSDTSTRDLEDQVAEDTKIEEDLINNQLLKVDLKAKHFFENICKKAFDTIKVKDLDQKAENTDIQYGNLTGSYNPTNSITSFDTSNSDFQEDQDHQLASLDLINLIKRTNQSKSLAEINQKGASSIKELSLVRKQTLVHLIERNRANKLISPFDEIAYFKFQSTDFGKKRKFVEDECSEFISSSNELETLETSCPIDVYLPNSVATFLMQFFFDIFQPSELKLYTPKTIDILLKLKSAYTPVLYLSNDLLTAYIPENILWNCFALFKFKFNLSYKLGLFNYLQSLFYVQMHLENLILAESKFTKSTCSMSQSEASKFFKIKKILPYFIEALILNGLLTKRDLSLFRASSSCFRVNAANTIEHAIKRHACPMKLKNMCRILIKNRIRDFSSLTVNGLQINESDKNFMLFNDEFERFYEENRDIF